MLIQVLRDKKNNAHGREQEEQQEEEINMSPVTTVNKSDVRGVL